MGAKKLSEVAQKLINAGADKNMPVRLLSKISQVGATDVLTQLTDLAQNKVDVDSLPTPLIAVVGVVVTNSQLSDLAGSFEETL
jgi:siroheme synthase